MKDIALFQKLGMIAQGLAFQMTMTMALRFERNLRLHPTNCV